MASERNDPGGTQNMIDALLAEREHLARYGKEDRVAEVDRELAARGWTDKKAAAAERKAAAEDKAERKAVEDEAAAEDKSDDDARHEAPKGRSSRQQNRT